MPTFIYKAKSADGKEKSGAADVSSEHELAQLLHQEGYFLTEIHLAGEEKKLVSAGRKFLSAWQIFKKVSLAEKLVFSRHLSVMIKSGLALTRSLEILSLQTQNSYFRQVISQIKDDVSRGQTFSDSLAKCPGVFSDFFISMVKVGETAGNLDEVLVVLADQMAKDHELRSKIRGAMVYPAVIVVVMAVIGVLMMTMVIPKLAATFSDLNITLPWTTQIIIGLSNFLSGHFIVGFILFLMIIFLIRLLLRTNRGKRAFDWTILKTPPFSGLSRKINSAYFARNLSSLIEAGVPIVSALQIVAKTLSNSFFQESLFFSAQQIQKGDPLSKALKEFAHLFPIMVVQMVEVGETTGTLSGTLTHLADFYEYEVTDITKNLSSVIEPILMVIIGIVVGFFAVSMLQPIYSLMNQI